MDLINSKNFGLVIINISVLIYFFIVLIHLIKSLTKFCLVLINLHQN